MDKPAHLTIDEAGLIVSVANYAMQRIGQPDLWSVVPADGRLRTVVEMMRNNASPLSFWPMYRNISREDLTFLAPYIDEWITGQAPPQNLPAEYWDWRPEALGALKERMQKEGLWPQKLVDP